ncbi:plasmid replication protein [Streptococcus pseudopneumoniae]|uniref:Rep family protein n=1 Tax=Streptococcus pseudopneumoniae TaxID=257758 RepID=UPI00110C3C27|nr:Rep family protein [Streptococcus pseudopneumoniae]TMR82278.1 plasmid replication protein [Streptococcus pseudopneumoniae]
MTKRIRNRRFLFEQQLKPDFWDWAVSDKKLFENWEENKTKIFRLIFDRIRELVEEEEFVEVAFIVHDKDISYGTKLVEPHIHGYIDFPKLMDLSKVALALGVEKERVETPKSRGGRHLTRINALAYLIHAKDKDKYQYPASDVETFDTLDYEAFINQNKEDFEKYAATKKREKSDESLDLTLSKIQLGELTYNDVMEDDSLAFLFGNNQQKFREGFNFYGERQTFLRLKSLERKEYQMTVIYIQGDSDIGKSELAKHIALQAQAKLNEVGLRGDIYSASSSNPFDNYLGEDILLLDDLREDTMRASDWLKLLDPLNSARMSARYQNKLVVPRLIIMPVYMSPKLFFGRIKAEDLNQFLRRINFLVDVSLKHGSEVERLYNISEVVKRKGIDFYEKKDGTIAVLNFRYEDLFCAHDRDVFIEKIVEECIYPRILPKEVKDVTND